MSEENTTEEKPPETLFEILRVFSKENQEWIPAIRDHINHEVSPVWVASVLYLIYDRYMSCVPDDQQQEFGDVTQKIFKKILEIGHEYVLPVNSASEVE